MTINIDELKKKIIYRSNYRGTKEMDKLLSTFTKKNINSLNYEDLIDLEKLLNIDDTNLYNFYTGAETDFEIENNKVNLLFKNFKYWIMAERLGFAPRKELPLCRFSRPVLSTAQPSLRGLGFISKIYKFNQKIGVLI